ncbi:MAG: DEAD/DEAH box helicase, partial [Methanoregula sp.]|nr:DEAD/DEAH box helicase [Methanoregula sp.]
AEQDILNGVFSRMPAGLGEQGIFVLKHNSTRGREVLIYSFYGSRFNRVLTLLLQEQLGNRVTVRYNDFVVKVQRAGKEYTAERVAHAIRDLQSWTLEAVGRVLPEPSLDSGKFAEALPRACLQEMAISDYYHVKEFLLNLCHAPVIVLADPEPDDPLTGP